MTTTPEQNARICAELRRAADDSFVTKDARLLNYAAARIEELERDHAALSSDYGALFERTNELLKALADLMPFVLEDYMPDMATPEFKASVEAAKKLTS